MGTIHLLSLGPAGGYQRDWKAGNEDEFEPGGIRCGSIYTVDFRLAIDESRRLPTLKLIPCLLMHNVIEVFVFLLVVVVVIIKTNESLYSIVEKPCKKMITWKESSNSWWN